MGAIGAVTGGDVGVNTPPRGVLCTARVTRTSVCKTVANASVTTDSPIHVDANETWATTAGALVSDKRGITNAKKVAGVKEDLGGMPYTGTSISAFRTATAGTLLAFNCREGGE